MKKNSILIALALFSAGGTWAEELPKDTLKVIDVEEIVVIAAPKENRKLREQPTAVTMLSQQDMQANQVNSIDIIPVAQALEEAGAAGTIFVKTADGKTASTDEIAKKTDYHVDGGPIKLQTEGKIMYTSDGVKLNSSFIAEISEGKNYIIFK